MAHRIRPRASCLHGPYLASQFGRHLARWPYCAFVQRRPNAEAVGPLALYRRRPLADSPLEAVDEAPGNGDMTLMADETEALTLRLLREVRTAQDAADAKLEAFMAEQRAANTKLEAKLDKLNIELAGVNGRVRKSEELLESIAQIMSDGAFG